MDPCVIDFDQDTMVTAQFELVDGTIFRDRFEELQKPTFQAGETQ